MLAVDATRLSDLELAAAGLREAERGGREGRRSRALRRSSACSPGAWPTGYQPMPSASSAILVICGSHVPTSTRQLAALARRQPESVVWVSAGAAAELGRGAGDRRGSRRRGGAARDWRSRRRRDHARRAGRGDEQVRAAAPRSHRGWPRSSRVAPRARRRRRLEGRDHLGDQRPRGPRQQVRGGSRPAARRDLALERRHAGARWRCPSSSSPATSATTRQLADLVEAIGAPS